MNAKEKPLLHRIQVCLGTIANMAPSNPCDVARKTVACDLGCEAANELYYAIADIGFGEFVDAEVRIAHAEQILSGRADRLAKLTDRQR